MKKESEYPYGYAIGTDINGLEYKFEVSKNFISDHDFQLSCISRKLKSLDLSNCPCVERLYCAYNNLTSLDLSNCPNMIHIQAHNNSLLNLNFMHNPNIELIYCDNNLLLDVKIDSQLNPKLRRVNIKNNDLIDFNIDIKKYKNIELIEMDNIALDLNIKKNVIQKKKKLFLYI